MCLKMLIKNPKENNGLIRKRVITVLVVKVLYMTCSTAL